jgi:DNA polymerase III subunit epsilon
MRLCGIDIETTGLDPDSEITELSWVFMDVPLFSKPPVIRQNYCNIKGELPADIVKLTGITAEHLKEYGKNVADILWFLEQDIILNKPDYIVAHNGSNFDRPMILHWCKKLSIVNYGIVNTPWIDTAQDLPPGRFPTSKLSYMAAECGFINPFPHSAVLDVLTMFRVLSNCDVKAVAARSEEPSVVIRAMVDFDDKELAKKQKFRWQELDNKIYPKCWVKRVKASDVAAERAAAQFKIVTIE